MARDHIKRWQEGRERLRRRIWTIYGVSQALFGFQFVTGLFASSAALQFGALETTDTRVLADAALKSPWSGRYNRMFEKAIAIVAFLFCAWCIGLAVRNWVRDIVPNATLMIGAAGAVAIVNAALVAYTWRHRLGNPAIATAWRAACNDITSACVVLAAGIGVYITEEGWPDTLATVIIAPFALYRAGAPFLGR